MNFEIVNFYPSIKHDHLKDGIEFAIKYTNIRNEETKLIEHTCQTKLPYDNNTLLNKR